MAQAFVPGLRASADAVVMRQRDLPVPGELSVQVGDVVDARQVIGRAALPGDLEIVRIAEAMGIEPHEVVAGLKVQLGSLVERDALLCEHRGFFGLFRSIYRSPYSGVVELIAEKTGNLGIRLPAVPLELHAYLSGVVESVQARSSVTVQGRGTFIQGIFGVGGERVGILKLLDVAATHEIAPSDLPTHLENLIVVGGARASGEALRAAAERGAVGFVTGSIDDRALASYLGYDIGIALTGDEDITMSVIITEGFGSLPISERVLTLLRACDGQQASMNGATQVRAGAVRPELFVSSGTAVRGTGEEKPAELRGLEVGAAVRLIRVPYFGLRGVVEELPHELVRIETGAHTRVLRARLEDGTLVTVPRANVELVA